MKQLSEDIIYLVKQQGFVVVSTLDGKGGIHCAAKGIAGITEEGKVYIIDLYQRNTFRNLKNDSTISITAIDEQQFAGYTLKGKAKIIEREEIKDHLIKAWENKVTQRVTKRIVRDIKKERQGPHHPEALFPPPKYLIEVEVEEIIDLTPQSRIS